MRKLLLAFVCVFAFNIHAKAQTNDGFESILFAADDTEKLLGAYINPAMTGLIYGMNSGWYHTAKVHKTFGFDISIGLNASIVPSENEIFRFADLGLSSNVTTAAPTAATVAGPNNLMTAVTFNGTVQGQNVSATFDMPGGVKDDLPLNAVPTPAVQVSLGLPGKFEAMLRLVPEVGSDNVKGNLLGIGLKKEITSWFGPMEKTPLHVSLLAAYTKMTVDYDIQAESSIAGSGQRAEFDLNAYTVTFDSSLLNSIRAMFDDYLRERLEREGYAYLFTGMEKIDIQMKLEDLNSLLIYLSINVLRPSFDRGIASYLPTSHILYYLRK